MYLMKAKKDFERLDQRELQEKRDKYVEQRVYSSSAETSRAADANLSPQLRGSDGGFRHKQMSEFKPEDLPDGACYRPKSVTHGDKDAQTAVRVSEYTGSFSVQGNDETSRTDFVRKQLEQMRSVEKRKKVLLVISVTGIKVCSEDGQSVYMAHALKRISYASCDPDNRQFSFLAREPKGHINVQFCHAFQSDTSDEAEELNTVVGNAFKMAYAQQQDKQPTFHELIELQLEQQKVQFQEYQEEAQRSLEKRLKEISTPTPFSEKAMQRMEMRRQSSGGSLEEAITSAKERAEAERQNAKQKAWAKYAIGKVKHKPGYFEGGPASPPVSPPPLMTFLSDPGPSTSGLRTDSESSQPSAASAGTDGFHAPSVAAIRESLENQNNNSKSSKSKIKGSPVTALKDTIDKQYNVNGITQSGTPQQNGGRPHVQVENYMYPVNNGRPKPTAPPETQVIDQSSSQSRPLGHMMHRPLPAIPPSNSVTNNCHPNQRASVHSSSSEEDPFLAYSPRSGAPAKQQGQARELKEKYGKSRLVQDSSPVRKRNKELVNGRQPESPRRDNGNMKPANGHVNANVIIQNKRDSEPIYRSAATQTFGEDKPDVYGVRPHSVPNPQMIYGVKVGPPGQLQYQEDIYDERYAIGPAASSSQAPRYQNDSPFHYQGSGDNCGASYESPVSPLRLDSLRNLDRSYIEDESLRHCSWYQPGIPREIALDILQQEEIGSFIVRDSTTHPGCYALSVKVPKFENPSGISHYLILKTQRGVKLKGLDKEWSNLTALVTHHTVMPEMLPCTLRLPRNNKNPTFKATDKDDKEEDPDYQRLSDFTSMMDSLKM
ncbi:tensin-1-like isoform X2 [Liolophura sinensis]|uniref:tensin-1-like isoform X2 n=1 Tax=Liolophura sinensis TaxID=3198878 RepID=UPI003159404A